MNDGLSARCLTFNGPLLHSFFMHHKFWTMPGVRTSSAPSMAPA